MIKLTSTRTSKRTSNRYWYWRRGCITDVDVLIIVHLQVRGWLQYIDDDGRPSWCSRRWRFCPTKYAMSWLEASPAVSSTEATAVASWTEVVAAPWPSRCCSTIPF